MRTFLCAAVALAVLSAGTTYGADEAKKKKKKNAAGLSGEVVKIDGAAGTVTVRVQLTKKSTEEKEYKVTDRTAVAEVKGDEKTELKAPKVEELFKAAQRLGSLQSRCDSRSRMHCSSLQSRPMGIQA
jgi:hypothetical protein